MRIAVVGSRNITVDSFTDYITHDDEIVSGGAVGVDQCAADYAKKNGIKITEFFRNMQNTVVLHQSSETDKS